MECSSQEINNGMDNGWLYFQKEAINDILNTDSLLVMSKGLGMTDIISKILRLYCTTQTFIVVLNANEQARIIISKIKRSIVNEEIIFPELINSKTSQNDRSKMYQRGGIYFITSLICIMDMLNKRLPLKKVTGILVYNVQKLNETSLECFALRLFRIHNQNGFIHAFSNDASSLISGGFFKVENLLKNLYVSNILLYPRFLPQVSLCLERIQPEVYEMEVPMTPLMRQCHEAILVALDSCVNELKKDNKYLDPLDLTLEDTLTKSLDLILRKQLDPVWHQVSFKTRQLIGDITTLRQLLNCLTQYDAITFMVLLNTYQEMSGQQRHPSPWLSTDAADQLYKASLKRIYSIVHTTAEQSPNVIQDRQDDNDDDHVGKSLKIQDTEYPTAAIHMLLESSPKWSILNQILSESSFTQPVKETSNNKYYGGSKFLIMVKNERMAADIKEYLDSGDTSLLEKRFNKYIRRKADLIIKTNKPHNIEQRLILALAGHFVRRQEVLQETMKKVVVSEDASEKPVSMKRPLLESINKVKNLFEFYEALPSKDQIIIYTYAKAAEQGDILNTVRPSLIVLYDANVSFIRQIEMYNALNSCSMNQPLKIYFLFYEDSYEQLYYVNEIKREKNGFDFLNKQKGTLFSSKNSNPIDLAIKTVPKDTKDSRNTRFRDRDMKIVIDSRELRSNLPSLLYREGFNLHVATITVGDYILTSNHCIERKSISDLFSSLKTGRLYNQAENMVKQYKNEYEIGSEISPSKICSKLCLLILHHPKLHIIWSRSPAASVNLFRLIKELDDSGSSDPVHFYSSEDSESITDKHKRDNNAYSDVALDVIRRLPGVTEHNLKYLLKDFKTLAELSQASEKEMVSILGKSGGKDLYQFFNRVS